MSMIKTVGIVGTGVIGASWTGLFLARGLRVVVSDPASDSEQKLDKYLNKIWPDLKKIGLAQGASLDNCQFVGASLKDHYSKVDFIQEVSLDSSVFWQSQSGSCLVLECSRETGDQNKAVG